MHNALLKEDGGYLLKEDGGKLLLDNGYAIGYKSINDALVAVLETIADIKVVYSKEEKAIKQFPAACVSAKEHTSRYTSVGQSGGNQRQYQHYVRLYFRTDETNDPDYEDVLESVVDTVIQALESNITLNGACQYAIPTSGIWRFGEKETPVRVFELVVTATVYVRRDNGRLM